jgi:hypothetical protein
MAGWGAVLAGLLGLFMIFLSGLNVYGILNDTSHDE